ncbi:death ligand signal enhancer isoform X2 [Alosa pseudoharengus]|uniref:death ligand signal enhancer isoform X2 n=1 Tax=Alosa pseudoharengus TaxID=34774 RepID=UPI003F896E45
MWRVQGIVGRVLYRWHSNAPLRLTQGPHREDEVINTSSLLSTNFHSDKDNREDGEERRRKRTSQFYYTGLPRYTALDAVGLGAAAVLLMQICKRIHLQFTSVVSRQQDLTRHVLPGALSLNRHRGALNTLDQSSSSSSTASESCDQKGALLSQESALSEESFADASLLRKEAKPEKQKEQISQDSPEEKLTEATENLKHVADTSVPVILNIIGLESAKAGDYEAAFSCFLAAAQHRYSKAQFNVGVCYEKGRGVQTNLNKALQFYRRAAAAGHMQAQYRCAKLLLSSRRQQRAEDLDTAITLLQSAAAAGLTEAQLYLGVLFSQDPTRDEGKAVQYLRMAAQSGDSAGLLYLGQCYEHGIGVNQCLSTAANLYMQSAAAGNQRARGVLTALCDREDRVLHSIRSAPCFSALDGMTLGSVLSDVFRETGPGQQQVSDWPVQPLPHSWSTGSLKVPPTHLYPLSSADNAASKWTIGVG